MFRKSKLPQAPLINCPKNVECLIADEVLDRFDKGISVNNLAGESGVISIYGDIGGSIFEDGMTVKKIAGILRNINGPVTVNINSPGGNFWEALAIYNTFRDYPHKVSVNIVGMAASAAAIIAVAGDEIRIAQSAFLMIHNTQLAVAGDRHEHRDAADIMENFDEALVGIFAAHTGMREKKIAEMLDNETWISGKDAVSMKFADAFLPADEVVEEVIKNLTPPAIEAANKIDRTLARANMPRSERRRLMQAYKGGMRNATTQEDGTHDAAKLNTIFETTLKEMKEIGN